MAGCTISPLAFTMEIIIRASKWVVGGERRQDGMRLTPIRAYMDDMTLVTATVPCMRRILETLNKNIKWAGSVPHCHLEVVGRFAPFPHCYPT